MYNDVDNDNNNNTTIVKHIMINPYSFRILVDFPFAKYHFRQNVNWLINSTQPRFMLKFYCG